MLLKFICFRFITPSVVLLFGLVLLASFVRTGTLNIVQCRLDMLGYQVKDLAVCWNDCFRQIFAYQRHEFVKELQYYCNELPFEYMYDLFRWKFLTGVLNIPNRLSVLYEYKSGTVNSLNNKYGFIMSVKDWRLSITLQPR